MAGEAVVGALRVVLGMDTVNFEEGVKRAVDKAEGLGNLLSKAFTATAIIGGIAVLGEGILKASEAMDQMGKTAQKVGVSVETFSALSYAAKLADVNTDTLANSMEKLGKNMSAVAGGAKGPAQEAFQALGISLQNGNGALKTTDVILGELADKFSNFKDSAAKTALAIALFGRAGAEMIPFLNQGREGIASAADEAKRFGLVISEDAAKAAETFNDNLKRLSSIMSGVMLQSTAAVSGEMSKLSATMLLIANNSAGISVVVTTLSTVFSVLLGVVNLVLIALDKMVANFKLLYEAAAAIATGDFGKLPGLFAQYVQNLKDAAQQTVDTGKAVLGMGQAFTFAGNAVGSFNQFSSQIKTDAPVLKTKTALDSFIDSQEKSLASLQAQVLTFNQLAGAAVAMKIQLDAAAIAAANHTTITKQQQAELDKLKGTAAFYTNILTAQQITLQNLTPIQLYEREMAQLNALFNLGVLGQEAYAAASAKAAAQTQVAYANAANNIVTNMADAFKTLASLNHQYAGLAKAFAIAQALTSTYLSAVNAYANTVLILGPVGAGIAAAAATAAGLANVAKIAATQFATGGSFKVGGGHRFTDTQLVTMAMAPGEMVDVKKTGSQSSPQEVYIQGMGPDDLFTGRYLRGLFDALNQGQRDGYKLKVA